jgi:hypothetical protein
VEACIKNGRRVNVRMQGRVIRGGARATLKRYPLPPPFLRVFTDGTKEEAAK